MHTQIQHSVRKCVFPCTKFPPGMRPKGLKCYLSGHTQKWQLSIMAFFLVLAFYSPLCLFFFYGFEGSDSDAGTFLCQ